MSAQRVTAFEGEHKSELTGRIAAVLAEHAPTYTDAASDPTTTFFCRPCSEARGDWVTWTPEHAAEQIAEVIRAAKAEGWDQALSGLPYEDDSPVEVITSTNLYRTEGEGNEH